mmetsp:Transcript_2991/g.4774  ORF Transcript_2991/g.4774 Transcript_2991/m.4774 type:complete len:280 (-) Transcript_2991:1653-2492(-)
MSPDLLDSLGSHPDALALALLKQPLHQVLRLLRHCPRKGAHAPCRDSSVQVRVRLPVKGRVPRHHLEKQDADGPEIRGAIAPLLSQRLGREVVGGTAHRVRALAWLQRLGKAKVREAQIPIFPHQQVLGFEVAIHEALGMHVVKRQHHLHQERARLKHTQRALLVNHEEQVAPRRVLHDNKQRSVGLEAVEHCDDERMLANRPHDAALLHHVRRLVDVKDLYLVHNLHRHCATRRGVVPSPPRSGPVRWTSRVCAAGAGAGASAAIAGRGRISPPRLVH